MKPFYLKTQFLSLLLSAALALGAPAAGALASRPSDSAGSGAATADSVGPHADRKAEALPAKEVAPTPEPKEAAATPSPSPSPTPAAATPKPGPQGTVGPTQPVGRQSSDTPSKPTVPEYAFNDATQHWDLTVKGTFAWNAAANRYDSSLYTYDPASGWYHVNKAAMGRVNALANAQAGTGSGSSQASGNPASALAALLGLGGISNNQTGPNSNNSASSYGSSTAMLQNLTNALIQNGDLSTAGSGNADVSNNTVGGDAVSGPSTVIKNLVNLLNAAWAWSGGGLSYLTQNLMGNQTGDILLQPSTASGGGGQLGGGTGTSSGNGSSAQNGTTGPNSVNNATVTNDNDFTIINKPTGAINNDVDLLAQSGNATVADNNTGGNATSGDATVDLNILNLINSSISSGQSFFGLLNIFGNLNGDILFPDGFLDGVADSPSTTQAGGNTAVTNTATGPGSSNAASSNTSSNANVVNSPSAAFNNSIQTGAQSGNATMADNTQAGNSQTGDATAKNNLYNLFDSNVNGDNAVLVLVNVMGKWVGHIMNLPNANGSTSALLTGNATVQNNQTGPNSTNNASTSQNSSGTLVNHPTGTITNTVKAGAKSGNASVADNTIGGNATSGKASVATNIANIFGSQLNLKKWFGVLVINVFGDWTGSVADNTSAGNSPVTSSGNGKGGVVSARTASSQYNSNPGSGSHTSTVDTSSQSIHESAVSSDVSSAQPQVTPNPFISIKTAAKVPSPETKAAAQATGVMLLLGAVAMMLAAAGMRAEKHFRK